MDNLNQYDPKLFQPFCESTDVYKRIIQNYPVENLIWDKFSNRPDKKSADGENIKVTPRYALRDYFFMSVFYYLQPLIDITYDHIYDLGCGENLFKPYLPRLIGMGAEHACLVKWYNDMKDIEWPNINSPDEFNGLPIRIQKECLEIHGLIIPSEEFRGDIHGFVDDQFVDTHQNFYQAVFSICALHYHPLTDFRKIVKDFVSMIQPSGRGFLALNFYRMLERTSENEMIKLFGKHDKIDTIILEKYILTELDHITGVQWMIVDVDLTFLADPINGNIRLVFEKK